MNNIMETRNTLNNDYYYLPFCFNSVGYVTITVYVVQILI